LCILRRPSAFCWRVIYTKKSCETRRRINMPTYSSHDCMQIVTIECIDGHRHVNNFFSYEKSLQESDFLIKPFANVTTIRHFRILLRVIARIIYPLSRTLSATIIVKRVLRPRKIIRAYYWFLRKSYKLIFSLVSPSV
jgi:hypothetical protein